MTATPAKRLLTINFGSSSLKAALYRLCPEERLESRAVADRIGLPRGRLQIWGANGGAREDRALVLPDHASALDALLGWLASRRLDEGLCAIGHRVVHGGPQYREPTLITPTVLAALHELVPLDAEHLPQALAAIETTRRRYPAVVQVACFDTGFHRHMPRVAQLYALPRALGDAGLRRYGFHGLSCEYILGKLRELDPVAANGRVIIAHLGHGASMTAVRGGVGIDTTMGLTPGGGLVMSTRTGDLDPGVLIYLMTTRRMDPVGLSRLVTRESGLLGVSDSSADMEDLLARETADPRAAEAIALFCHQARKFLGALVATLEGLNTLVFTAGIGEHAASIRARICQGLGYLGLEIEPDRNAAHAPIISSNSSRVVVRVIPTDEDAVVARHTRRLIESSN